MYTFLLLLLLELCLANLLGSMLASRSLASQMYPVDGFYLQRNHNLFANLEISNSCHYQLNQPQI